MYRFVANPQNDAGAEDESCSEINKMYKVAKPSKHVSEVPKTIE